MLRIHELEKDNAALRGRAEEAVHRGKLDASNVRVEMLRERGDIERDRDRLHSQLQGIVRRFDPHMPIAIFQTLTSVSLRSLCLDLIAKLIIEELVYFHMHEVI